LQHPDGRHDDAAALSDLADRSSGAARQERTMAEISWQDFQMVEICVGTIMSVEEFPEARKPAWKLTVDFGEELGKKRASAQITDLYTSEQLVGKQVLAVVNFAPKQIGPFMSECLVTGFVTADGPVVLAVPDRPVGNGSRLA
jgi:tRNA-binding protein